MPFENGRYVSPAWQNGTSPAIDATEMLAICSATAQTYPITGSSAPTTSTIGAIGQLYIYSNSIYICSGISGDTYTWVLLYTNGVLQLAAGGTAATDAATARTNLGINYNNLGVNPVATGGTAASDAATARTNLGINYTNLGVNPILTGGTGGTTKVASKNNLGISWGTTAPSGGDNGDIYLKLT